MEEDERNIISSGDFDPKTEGVEGGAAESISGRVPHIVVIDGDPTTAEPLRAILVAAGYRVAWFKDGRQAAAALRGPVLIDLVILDYFDPQVNGAGFLQDIAAHAFMQRPAILVASAWLDEFHPAWIAQRKRLHPLAQGLIKAYVSKPYSLSKMNAFIQNLFGTAGQKAEDRKQQAASRSVHQI